MLRILSAAAAAAVLAVPALACEGFEAHDAHARASTPMARSGAAFMVLHNHGDADCRIIAARSDVAERTELHTHVQDAQGVMRMVELEAGIALPAGGEHALERGGDHIMFLGLNRPLVEGETLTLTLVFEDGAERSIEVPVDLSRMMPAQGHGHGHGHGHGN